MVFAIIIILTYAVGYNMLASYNLQSAFSGFSFYGESTPLIIGIILAVLFALCVMGGAKRLTRSPARWSRSWALSMLRSRCLWSSPT